MFLNAYGTPSSQIPYFRVKEESIIRNYLFLLIVTGVCGQDLNTDLLQKVHIPYNEHNLT